MFWDYSEQNVIHSSMKPLSFEKVREKLEHDVYNSANTWVYEMRQVLTNVITNTSSSSLRNAAGKQLLKDFEKEMAALSPSLSPQTLKLQYTEQQLSDFVVKATPPLPRFEASEKMPAAELFKVKVDCDAVDVDRLSDDIRMLSSPALIMRVAAFIYDHQPEALSFGNDSNILILFSLMADETLQSLRDYVSKLTFNAATGRVNAVVRTPGVFDINPTDIRSD